MTFRYYFSAGNEFSGINQYKSDILYICLCLQMNDSCCGCEWTGLNFFVTWPSNDLYKKGHINRILVSNSLVSSESIVDQCIDILNLWQNGSFLDRSLMKGWRKKSWTPERAPTVVTMSVCLSVCPCAGYRAHLGT